MVGAGFGGLAVVKGLAGAGVEIVLVDRTNHNLFQPLLYQVATAALAPSDIAVPARGIFTDRPDVTVFMGSVTGVDPAKKTIEVAEIGTISYDTLVLATGSVYSWFGHDEWSHHAHVLKTLDDALRLRSSLLAAFEVAETLDNEAAVRRMLTFVIVGGGPTGVELAGAIAELAHFDPGARFSPYRLGFGADRPVRGRAPTCSRGSRLACPPTRGPGLERDRYRGQAGRSGRGDRRRGG